MRNKRTLTPEVRELVETGKLHEFDGIWIAGVAPENQIAAAEKCMNGSLDSWKPIPDRPKTRVLTDKGYIG